jgi:Tol biopolymer transport system component
MSMHDASIGFTGNGDAPSPTELQHAIVSQQPKCPKHRVGVHTEHCSEILRRRKAFPWSGLSVCDRSPKLGGHLLEERYGTLRVNLDGQHCAIHTIIMSTMIPALLDRAVPTRSPDPAEALIKEAHQRKRRRRSIVSGVVVVVLVAALGGFLLSRSKGGTPTSGVTVRPPAPKGPVVNERAFTGDGQLAFVSRGTLWVLDGSTGALRKISTPGLVPDDPSFSPDGHWLAFVASKEITSDYGGDVVASILSSSLWIARADGTDAHAIGGIAFNAAYGWSPHANLFAVAVGKSTTVPLGSATGVDLIDPTGSISQLVVGTLVTSAVWSPDGSALAVSTQSGPSGPATWKGTLTTYPVDGGSSTMWESLAGSYIVSAGWWPVWGIGYTTVGVGAVPGGSATADGSPFYTLARPGAAPKFLGMTLQNESSGTPSGTSSGWLAFVATSGGVGRSIWQGKQVMVCSPITSDCSAVTHPTNTVTLDPIWSPNGASLAYVQGPALQSVGFPQPAVAHWYGAHECYLFDPTTGSVQMSSQTRGATVPLWSGDGNSLLYVSNNGLWLNAALGRPPVEIAHPLFTPGEWPSFYGQVGFSDQFSWSSPATTSVPSARAR